MLSNFVVTHNKFSESCVELLQNLYICIPAETKVLGLYRFHPVRL